MSVEATWTSDSEAFKRRDRDAQAAGLIAAAQVIINAVKRGLAGGYKSGAFVKGIVINSVTKGAVGEDSDGSWIRIGSNILYALFWELGHHNIFTRKYERAEVWVPAMQGNAGEAASAFSRVYIRIASGS